MEIRQRRIVITMNTRESNMSRINKLVIAGILVLGMQAAMVRSLAWLGHGGPAEGQRIDFNKATTET